MTAVSRIAGQVFGFFATCHVAFAGAPIDPRWPALTLQTSEWKSIVRNNVFGLQIQVSLRGPEGETSYVLTDADGFRSRKIPLLGKGKVVVRDGKPTIEYRYTKIISLNIPGALPTTLEVAPVDWTVHAEDTLDFDEITPVEHSTLEIKSPDANTKSLRCSVTYDLYGKEVKLRFKLPKEGGSFDVVSPKGKSTVFTTVCAAGTSAPLSLTQEKTVGAAAIQFIFSEFQPPPPSAAGPDAGSPVTGPAEATH